jgi:hypothetical protein
VRQGHLSALRFGLSHRYRPFIIPILEKSPIQENGLTPGVAVSIGGSLAGETETAGSIVKPAANRLYQIKKNGPNRFTIGRGEYQGHFQSHVFCRIDGSPIAPNVTINHNFSTESNHDPI